MDHGIDGVCCDSFGHMLAPAMHRAGISGQVASCPWNWPYWWEFGEVGDGKALCQDIEVVQHTVLVKHGKCWSAQDGCIRHHLGQRYAAFCAEVERGLASGHIGGRLVDCAVPHTGRCGRPGAPPDDDPKLIMVPIIFDMRHALRCSRNISLRHLLSTAGGDDPTVNVYLFALAVAQHLRHKPSRPEEWEALLWAIILVGDLGNMRAWAAFVAADVRDFAEAYEAGDGALPRVLETLRMYSMAWLAPAQVWPEHLTPFVMPEVGVAVLYHLWVRQGRPNSTASGNWVTTGKRATDALMARLIQIEAFSRAIGTLTKSFVAEGAFERAHVARVKPMLSLRQTWLGNCFLGYSDPERRPQHATPSVWARHIYCACVTLVFAARAGQSWPPPRWFRNSLVIDDFYEARRRQPWPGDGLLRKRLAEWDPDLVDIFMRVCEDVYLSMTAANTN